MPASIPRLKRRADFLRVAATRRKWVAPGLIVQARRRGGNAERTPGPAADSRVGFTVSKKVGNAVARNRARRRLRAAVDEVFPLHAEKGYDFVIIGRGATLNRPYGALVRDLTKALKRLGAFRDGNTGGKNGRSPEG